jgi:hypothetical protein
MIDRVAIPAAGWTVPRQCPRRRSGGVAADDHLRQRAGPASRGYRPADLPPGRPGDSVSDDLGRTTGAGRSCLAPGRPAAR